MIEPCACPLAGYCQRHATYKTAHLYKRCQTNEKFRKFWDERVLSRGADTEMNLASYQTPTPEELLPEADRKLLGDRVADLLAAIGIPECRGCGKRKEWLNKAHAWIMNQCCTAPGEPKPHSHCSPANGQQNIQP